ncbi:MAG: MerC domain-containing protein [Wenzhouxiangellaceae bacterium]
MNSECDESASSRPPGVGWADRVGIIVSAFCLVQCLILPLALLLVPVASLGALMHEMVHVVLLGLIIPISVLAFGLGYLRHRKALVLAPVALGIGLLIVAVMLEHNHAVGPVGVALVTSSGGLALIVAHLMNIRARNASL